MSPEVRRRLREGGIDRFVDLLVEDLLDRPVTELVDPEWLARQLAHAARSASDDPQVEEWFRERITDARARVPAGKAKVPAAILGPLREVLRRPYTPDRVLVGRLMDHTTARLLLRNLFQDLLVSFARKLRSPLPSTGRTLPLGGFKKLSEGVLGVVGAELEAQIEAKAREFMDAALDALVVQLAAHLSDPRLTREYGEWRVHGLDVVLDTELGTLAGEIEKLDPDSLVATGAAVVRGITHQEGLADQLRSVIEAALELAGDRSARSLLGGLEVHGIDAVREVLAQRGRALVETEAFERWWDDMNGAAAKG